MKNLPGTLLFFLILGTISFAQLNGTKTINPAGSGNDNYTSFNAAVSALNASGTTQGVTFMIANGTYQENSPLIIDIKTNKPAQNTKVTFKPMPGAAVILNVGGQNQTDKFAVRIGNPSASTDYIIFDGSNTDNGTTRNFTITTSDSKYGLEPFDICGDNITVKNCIILAKGTMYDNSNGILLRNTGPVAENCTIENNKISAVNAISLGSDTLNVQKGNVIRNNELHFYLRGVYANKVAQTLIENNEVIGDLYSEYQIVPCFGIFAGTAFDNTTEIIISKNNIRNIGSNNGTTPGRRLRAISTSGSGIFTIKYNKIHDLYNATTDTQSYQPCVFGIQLSNGSASAVYNILNNAIWGLHDMDKVAGRLGTIVTTGIECTVPGEINIINNTVFIEETERDNHESYALYIGNGMKGSNIRIFNNILVNSNSSPNAKSYAIYRSSTTVSNLMSDHNLLYADGKENSFLAFCGMADRKTFMDWFIASPWDDHSVTNQPGFKSADDVSISDNSWVVNGQGLPFAEIPEDIDGKTRSVSIATGGTDIGAYEYTPSEIAQTTFSGYIVKDSVSVFTGPGGRKAAEILWSGTSTSVFPQELKLTYSPGRRALNNSGQIINNGIDRMFSFSFPKGQGNDWTAKVILYYNELTELHGYKEKDLILNMRPETGDGGWTIIQALVDTIDHSIQFTTKSLGTYGLVNSVNSVLSVKPDGLANMNYNLEQNYPNPFNPSTTIKYTIPEAMRVRMVLFNSIGQTIRVLTDEFQLAGSHDLTLKADDLSSGIYYYQIQTVNFVQTKKLLLLK
ncbi:MAG: T9SS type A sorting domain-containing protein [Bacillota bacterium]